MSFEVIRKCPELILRCDFKDCKAEVIINSDYQGNWYDISIPQGWYIFKVEDFYTQGCQSSGRSLIFCPEHIKLINHNQAGQKVKIND